MPQRFLPCLPHLQLRSPDTAPCAKISPRHWPLVVPANCARPSRQDPCLSLSRLRRIPPSRTPRTQPVCRSEAVSLDVKERIDSRAWTFRNRHRLALPLSLVRWHGQGPERFGGTPRCPKLAVRFCYAHPPADVGRANGWRNVKDTQRSGS